MLIPGNLQSHFKSKSLEAPSFLTADVEEELNVESTTSTYSSSDNTSSGSLNGESDSSYNYSSEFIEKLNHKLIDDFKKENSRMPSSPSANDDELSLENPSEKRAGTPSLDLFRN